MSQKHHVIWVSQCGKPLTVLQAQNSYCVCRRLVWNVIYLILSEHECFSTWMGIGSSNLNVWHTEVPLRKKSGDLCFWLNGDKIFLPQSRMLDFYPHVLDGLFDWFSWITQKHQNFWYQSKLKILSTIYWQNKSTQGQPCNESISHSPVCQRVNPLSAFIQMWHFA